MLKVMSTRIGNFPQWMGHLSYTMAADALATQRPKLPAAMILSYFSSPVAPFTDMV